MNKPRCKCGKVCRYAGPIGGYGKLCQACSDIKNAKARARRAYLKEAIPAGRVYWYAPAAMWKDKEPKS